ncbi:hypothetical protein D9758_013218 [Tetrapyrgos nigripes]|uniref:CCHC-type domain-containing protein n=1 Tax=Tetrapyrgos nigripes TaxID=182062 RepID=A0A8H5CRG8_9AGAR|nr:hypothetical protein D9758_013218 [Tetrapyrgos nigripes]
MTSRRSASADPNLHCADRPHVFHPSSSRDATYFAENGDNPWILDPKWVTCHNPTPRTCNSKGTPKPNPKTESEQGTSTPTNQPSKSNPVPETPSNNPPEPDNPTSPPSSPTIPSTKGSSVAPHRPPTPPSPNPSDPNDSFMADTPPIGSNGTSERGRKLDTFNGERSEAKRWLALFNNYLRMNKSKYPTEESQVSLFLSFFTGEKGGDWATQRLTERDEDEEDEELASTLEKPLASEDVVRTKIDFARMKGADISSYNSIFDTYREESDFGETALLEFYQDGLPPKLREAVRRMYPKWDDFKEYKERAVELHLEWLKEWERQGHWKTTSTLKSSPGPSQGRTVASVNALMNMGPGANLSFTPLPKLTPDERDRLQKLGACFACRQTGHMSNECPTFPKTSSQNTS